LAPLVLPALVQFILERRKRASLARLQKEIIAHGAALTEHGAALGALKQHAAEAPEKTDPAIAQAREAQRHGLEQRAHKLEGRVDHLEHEVRDLKAKIERRADDDARADRELVRELGRVAGILEAQNGGSGTRSRRG
jgi:polyhydroxyalkanoate synthesis regulator phasin